MYDLIHCKNFVIDKLSIESALSPVIFEAIRISLPIHG